MLCAALQGGRADASAQRRPSSLPAACRPAAKTRACAGGCPPPRRVPLLPSIQPSQLSLQQRCLALNAWYDVTVGALLPLAVLAALERRARERIYLQQQQRQQGQPTTMHWMLEDPRCPPRLEPAACFLFSCVAFAAAALAAALLLPAPGGM